jgi:hypothetical protein
MKDQIVAACAALADLAITFLEQATLAFTDPDGRLM